MNSNNDSIAEEIKTLFFNLFREHGYGSLDYFDFSVWFLERNLRGMNPREYAEELMNSTPKDDDVINTTILQCLAKKKEKNFKIYVGDFIEEITKKLQTLHKENKYIDDLIKKYSAYETVNTIDQNILHFNKYEERASDNTRSIFRSYISKVKGLSTGDYKFSLLISQESDKYSRTLPEEFEYKLNHVMQIQSSNMEEITFNINEYEFPSVDFFCSDNSGQESDFASGTNLISFQIKMENLSKSYSDSILSEKFKFLELLIGNSTALMNNFEKVKTLEANISLENSFYDVKLLVIVKIEFDPITLMSVFQKIHKLLKNIISYKVQIDHKYGSILDSFEPIKEKIISILEPPKKEDKGCTLI